MAECPRCHQLVDSQAIACPHCKYKLKAFGHPGIPLHRADRDEFLCQSCLYHEDDTCNFPKRPYAKECTLYQDHTEPIVPQGSSSLQWRFPHHLGQWIKSNPLGMVIFMIIVISLLLAF